MPLKSKEFFNLSDHQLNGESGFKTHWGNFGYWQSAQTYPEACEALAILVADAIDLNDQSHLLDCGFGSGEQLLTWVNRYDVASIMGINLSKSQTAFAEDKVNQLKASDVNSQCNIALYEGDALAFMASHNLENLRNRISHIIALDCAYHFQERDIFFQKTYEALDTGGKIALTDFTFRTPKTLAEKISFTLISTLFKLAKIPKDNVISLTQYQQVLANAGFKSIEITDITEPVIEGFCQWLPRYKQGYKNTSALPVKSSWMKYQVTAAVLNWACRHDIIRYQLISASKSF